MNLLMTGWTWKSRKALNKVSRQSWIVIAMRADELMRRKSASVTGPSGHGKNKRAKAEKFTQGTESVVGKLLISARR
jgi:hypothetical protein